MRVRVEDWLMVSIGVEHGGLGCLSEGEGEGERMVRGEG